MLQLKNICKSYTTGDFTQVALNDVSISFRDNEFVAILGPSGSGKTTLLNVMGGLDHYDSGDMIVDGISTHRYKDRDWDTFRNNRIGFVFQSYNLIPHQTILQNVELALTLSGVGKAERTRRAKEALPAQGSIEWVVIVVCIAVALIAALVYLSNQMNIKINTVSKTLAGTNVNGANTPS